MRADYSRAAAVGAVLGALVVIPAIFAQNSAFVPSEHSPPQPSPIFIVVSPSVLSALAALALPICLVALLSPARRALGLWALIFSLAFAGVAQLGSFVTNRVRLWGLESLAQRTEPMIAAINQYEDLHGVAPPDIAALVAGGFLEMPSGTPACAAPEYIPGDPKVAFGGSENPWILISYCRTLSVDYFCYFPNQDYLEHFDRIGTWGYRRG